MQRREVLKTVAGAVAVAMTSSVMASGENHEHHHDHGVPGGKGIQAWSTVALLPEDW